MKHGECIAVLRGHAGEALCATWEETGKRLLSGGRDKTVMVWEICRGDQAPPEEFYAGKCIQTLKGHSDVVTAVAWSRFVPENKHDEPPEAGMPFASASRDETVRVWGAMSGKGAYWRCLHVLQGHTAPIRSLLYDPVSGLRLASASHDGSVKLWDATGKNGCLQTLTGPKDIVTALAWHMGGKLLASGSDDCLACVWDATKGNLLFRCEGHPDSVTAVAWYGSNDFLATGCKDKRVRIWRLVKPDPKAKGEPVGTAECCVTLVGHSSAIRGLSWTEDGKQLVSVSADPFPLVWLAAKGCYVKQVEAAIFGEEIKLHSSVAHNRVVKSAKP